MPSLPAPAGPLTRSTSQPTDDELVEAARAGDQAAFAELFNRHWRLVARLSSRFFRRAQDVEGLVQDTFSEAFLDLGRYRGGHERSFVAWLKRVTVTTCYDALRRERVRGNDGAQRGDSDVGALIGPGPDVPLSVEQLIILRDLAAKLLARLAPDDRLVLTLLNMKELSVADIAELTGWSETKVKVRAHRARKSLRAILRTSLEPPPRDHRANGRRRDSAEKGHRDTHKQTPG